MKKIYFLLLISMAFTSLGYGQITRTLADQDFDGTTSNWNVTELQSPGSLSTTSIVWGEMTTLTSDAGTIPSASSPLSNTFWGLHYPGQAVTDAQDFYIQSELIDITDHTSVMVYFDYDFITDNNRHKKPTVTVQIRDETNATQIEQILTQAGDGTTSDLGTYEVIIPDTRTYNSISLRIFIDYNDLGRGNGNLDWRDFIIGFDNFKIETTEIFDGFIYLNDTDTWYNGEAPSSSTGDRNAIILAGTYEIDTDINLANVYTEDGAGITIQPTGSLEVTDIDTNNNLLINSTSSDYGSLVVNGTVTGTAKYSRHINGDTSDLISSPLPGETFTDFAVENASNLIETGDNQVRFGPYNKNLGQYEDWSTLDALNNAILAAGEGYRTKSSDNGNFIFTGSIETGPVSVAVAYTSAYASQWNLIGNPYPSYISIGNFVSTNLDLFETGKEAVYGYDGNASDGWLIYNLSTGIQMTPGQGFFVAVPSGVTEYMNFNTDMRSNGPGDDFIAGRTTDIHKSHFKLSLLTGETTKHTSLVYFNDIASLGFDKGYDATLYGNNSSGFTMFTRLVEDNPNYKIGIQTLPNSELGTGIAIPLGIIAPKGQQITLKIEETTLNEGATVYLEDTKTNTWTLLTEKEYTFKTEEKLTGLGRFVIHTTDESRLGIEEQTIDNIQLISGSGSLKIKGQLEKDTQIVIYDLQGRALKTLSLNNTVSDYTINTTNYSSGVYLIAITNKKGRNLSKRVILK